MENVLILDFDGPLWPDRVIKHHPLNRNPVETERIQRLMVANGDSFGAAALTYWKMDETAVGMLNQIMEIQPFYTVVSSSWRDFCSKETILMLFEENGLNLQLHEHWMTPLIDRGMYGGYYGAKDQDRLLEISRWVANHKDTLGEFAILDDPGSGGVLMDDNHVRHAGIDPARVVLVDYTIGMELEHFRQLRDILTK